MIRSACIRCLCGFVLAIVSCYWEQSSYARTWTDSTGKHTIEADFVSLESGMVTLKESSGDTIRVPLEKLSNADQELAKSPAAKTDSGNPFVPSARERPAGNAKANAPSQKAIRLSLAIMDHGDCYLKIEETTTPIDSATKFEGTPLTLDRMPRAEVLKAVDGRCRIVHSFDPKDELAKIFPINKNTESNALNGNLTFKAEKGVGGFATYWCQSKLPLIICFDRLTIPLDTALITDISAQNVGLLKVNQSRAKDGKTQLHIAWIDQDQDNKPGNRSNIFDKVDIDPSKGFDYRFRLPLPNNVITDVFKIVLGAASGAPPQRCEVSRLLVQGFLIPMIGIEFKEKSSVVFVNNIVPGTIADGSGLQQGDVILSINGQQPKTVKDATGICDLVSMGDQLSFKISRSDHEQDIILTAE